MIRSPQSVGNGNGGVLAAVGTGASGSYKTFADGVIASGSLNSISSASAGFLASDVGKTINLLISGSVFQTTISSFVSATSVNLTSGAPSAASSIVFEYYSDDSTIFNSALAASNYYFINPGHNYAVQSQISLSSNKNLVVAGTLTNTSILNAQTISSPNHTLGGPRVTNVTVDFQGGQVNFSPVRQSVLNPTLVNVGVELWNTDFFAVKFPRTYGDGGGFQVEFTNSTFGCCIGGVLYSTSGISQNGNDGIHGYGNFQYATISSNVVLAGDDSLSFTCETALSNNATLKGIVATGNVLTNYGHSGYKITTSTATGTATIQDIVLVGNYIECIGGGAPIIMTNPGHAIPCVVKDILVGSTIAKGGGSQFANLAGLQVHNTKFQGPNNTSNVVYVDQCNSFSLQNIEVEVTDAPVATASSLTVNSATFISGNTVNYVVSGGSGTPAVGNYFCPSGMVHKVNNTPGLITNVSGTTISVTNVSRRSMTDPITGVNNDESGSSGSAVVYAAPTSAVVDIRDCVDGDISVIVRANNGGAGFIGPAVTLDTNTSQFCDRIRLNVKVEGLIAGPAVLLANATRCQVTGTSANSTGGVFVQENPTTGTGNNEIVGCKDFDATSTITGTNGFGQILRINSTTTRHRNNHGNTSDYITGSITTNVSGVGTVTVNDTVYAENIGSVNAFHMLARSTDGTAVGVTFSGGVFTITTSAASKIVNYEIRPPY